MDRGTYLQNLGFMHCGTNYANQCKIDIATAWKCDPGDKSPIMYITYILLIGILFPNEMINIIWN